MYLYIEVRSPNLKHRLGLRADKLLVLIKNHNQINFPIWGLYHDYYQSYDRLNELDIFGDEYLGT